MKCPICENARMREVEKDGVLIDICPDCKGVWLDRGELDKLMKGVHELQEEYGRLEQQSNNYASQGAQVPPTVNQQPYTNQQPNYGQQQQQGYGSQPPQYGNGYDKHNKYGQGQYGKHGQPYKKKKTVLDVFGDLFD